MADDKGKREWLERVLGVSLGAGERTGTRDKLLPIWTAAKEEADLGIGKLQDALRSRNDEDLQTIVEYGLYGATTGQTVKLSAALRDADAKGTEGAYEKVVAAVEDFRDFLDAAPIVDLMENNPFGVAVSLRATLGPALAEIERIAA